MPVIVVLMGSCLGAVSAALALLLDLGAVLALSVWFGGGAVGLAAALRPAR